MSLFRAFPAGSRNWPGHLATAPRTRPARSGDREAWWEIVECDTARTTGLRSWRRLSRASGPPFTRWCSRAPLRSRLLGPSLHLGRCAVQPCACGSELRVAAMVVGPEASRGRRKSFRAAGVSASMGAQCGSAHHCDPSAALKVSFQRSTSGAATAVGPGRGMTCQCMLRPQVQVAASSSSLGSRMTSARSTRCVPYTCHLTRAVQSFFLQQQLGRFAIFFPPSPPRKCSEHE